MKKKDVLLFSLIGISLIFSCFNMTLQDRTCYNAPVSIVLTLIAVLIAAAVPVSVPTEPASTLTVVLPSRVLRAAASTDESVTEMV